MNKGTYLATQGMVYESMRMDMIANNLANLNSAGFKKSHLHLTAFKDYLNQSIPDKETGLAPNSKNPNLSTATVANYRLNLADGPVRETNQPLDLAIQGKGFFGVLNHDGTVSYTRNGSFTLDDQGNLVTQNGLPILDPDEQPIQIDQISNLRVTNKGEIFDGEEMVSQLMIRDFPSDSLIQKGNSLYQTTDSSEGNTSEFNILQGYLEGSNANPVHQMVQMIETLRNFQGYQKTIQAFNDSVQQINETARS
ncbi:flagellar hook-basal body protein [Candidatus Poribacteria bacterium]|nr:hypothetical protein [Candidatus Poribacteria bacterium]MCH2575334.1 flagellar hook-basal body protein [Candidatus Poribacteria bacterium]|tara:strand:- start:303 stop:1058 length:756 start_codon:yes stop_codon:yes gene_type:complete